MYVEETANVTTKQAIQAAGGGTLALAIAMQEDKHLISRPHSDYPFGDKYPEGGPKLGDAANFGIYKMNWYMIKQCPTAKRLVGNRPPENVWRDIGVRINDSPSLATQILLEAMRIWSPSAPNAAAPGPGNFWAGHRWGESGLRAATDVKWADIANYYGAVQKVKAKCESDPAVWTSNIRYGELVPPV